MFKSGVITLCFFIGIILPTKQNPVEPFFRKDYHYIGRQEAFYKIHTVPQKWRTAHTTCALEGTTLVYPETQDETSIAINLLKENFPKETAGLWLGAHDIFAEGVYITVQGGDVVDQYPTWAPGEPNDADNNEDCVAMTRDGKLNDYNCANRLPFLCKKTLSTLTANPVCETPDKAYVANGEKTRCYKVHTNPKNWADAFATCHAEQAYLAIINNASEAFFLASLLQKTPLDKIKIPFYKGHIAVGFHDLYQEGQYYTIKGQSLHEAGYDEWQKGQPDNYKGSENCGSISHQGLLNDINCDFSMVFICERDLGDPNVVDFYSRFNT